MIDLKKVLGTPVEVETSAGKLRLHRQRTKDFLVFVKLSQEATAVDRLRTYLPSIASIVGADDQADDSRIDTECVKNLSDDDLERVAEAYVKVLPTELRSTDAAAARGADESAVTYLDRLLRANYARQRAGIEKASKELVARYGPSFSAAVAALEQQSASIRDSVAKYHVDDELLKRFATPSFADTTAERIARDFLLPTEFAPRLPDMNPINDAMAQRARERREEMEITRDMGKMMAQTASLLTNLSDTTTQFLRQFAESATKSDRTNRRSLHIAVWSVSISAALALVIAIFAGKSYFQDQHTNESTDKWQESVARSLKDNAAAAQERDRLLTERLLDLANRQNAVQPATPIPRGQTSTRAVPRAK